MNLINYLNQNVRVKVDRPLGSKHAKHGFIYPVNYGFVPDTISGDGEELDCYVLGVFEPLNEFTGKCIAIIHRINDNDDKLIIVPENKFCFIQLENNQIMIEENNNNWNVGKMEYPYGNGINISMSVNNVENLYEQLKAKDIKFFIDFNMNEDRVDNKLFQDKEFLLQDPDGYLLRFNN